MEKQMYLILFECDQSNYDMIEYPLFGITPQRVLYGIILSIITKIRISNKTRF